MSRALRPIEAPSQEPPRAPGVRAGERVVLFDGECVLCNAGAQTLMRADRRALFKLGTTQSEAGKRVLAWYGLSIEAPDSFVLAEGPDIHLRSTAYVRILWRLGPHWKLLATLLWLVPRPLRDWGYDWVARNRFRMFGRQETCTLMTPDNRAHLWVPVVLGEENVPFRKR